MADQLATPEDLASLLQQDLDASTANLVLDAATASVQAAAGNQRILQVVGDTANLTGLTDSWLDLPQIPVTAVASVTLDGATLTAGSAGDPATTYRLRGNRLWRGYGWQTYVGEPSDVVVVNTHGYAAGSQDLQLARGATLSIAKGMYANPAGVAREQIDDYAVSYARAAGEAADLIEAAPGLRAALRRKYGRRIGLARLG